MSKIKTLNGHMFDYLNPESNIYDYNEISSVISKEQRFANHLQMDWTVGQHALLVHKISCFYTNSVIERKLALHHDDLEAYFRDIPTPLKYLCSDYRRIYSKHEFYYYSKILNLPPKSYESEHLAHADRLALQLEDVLFGSRGGEVWHDHTIDTLRDLDKKLFESLLIPYIQKLLITDEAKIVTTLRNTANLYKI